VRVRGSCECVWLLVWVEECSCGVNVWWLGVRVIESVV
jgi:hypothetical protein